MHERHDRERAVRLTVTDDAASVAAVRAAVERAARECGLSREATFGLKVAATEAVANALRHPDAEDEAIAVTLAARPEGIEVEIANRGQFRIGTGLDVERGRGLPLIFALADEVELATSDEGTRVRIRAWAGDGRSRA
ncbi:MAG: ATP-binding protein [Thermoleophilia bacterium]|nr:ATP-binding protein [Thermoleophilia bacterium]